jgi:hypothetical protein
MDVAVQAPGNDPLVPAYPNIVVRLEGYAVTLNEDITYTDGGSLANGSTWNRATTQSTSRSTERHWEAGAGTEFGFSVNVTTGAVDFSAKVSFHADYGETYNNSQTSSTSAAAGGSALDEENWSRARSLNPTDAARIKLFLKVHNYGTACASNIIPTLALRIGGANVATFEPSTQINMLVPGGEYPPDPGVQWVVDSIDNGSPLSLTMDELRALERGVPVNISVTQLRADVMLMEGPEGGWAHAGDCNEYIARCDAVGANLHVELGDGSFVHYVVYADDTPSAPPVTLGDALGRIGLGNDNLLSYFDREGAPQTASLEGYTFLFDQETLIRNGWDLDDLDKLPYTGFKLRDTLLGPETCVYAKAPREQVPGDDGPVIYYANLDPRTLEVRTCAGDYQGLDRVEFIDKLLTPYEMTEEMEDSGFFFLVPDPEYVFDGTERISVTNLAGQTRERAVDMVFYPQPPQPAAPVFNNVRLDFGSVPPTVYANVTNPSPTFPIQWVKAFHPQLKTPTSTGYVDLGEPINAYEDPNGWVAKLPEGFSFTNLKLVAFVADGCYSERFVSGTDIEDVLRTGTAVLEAKYRPIPYLLGPPYPPPYDAAAWQTVAFDFESGLWASSGWQSTAVKFPSPWETTHWANELQPFPPEIEWRMTFSVGYKDITGSFSFDQVDRDVILSNLEDTPLPGDITFEKDDVFVLWTTTGLPAAATVLDHQTEAFWEQGGDGQLVFGEKSVLTLQYVVYANPSANAGPDQVVVVSPLAEKVQLNGTASVGADSYTWSSVAYPAGAEPDFFAIVDNTTTTHSSPWFIPDVEGNYELQLQINGDVDLTDTVVVDVSFPKADAGSTATIPFYDTTGDPIVLDGTGSTGADSYYWDWDSLPTGSNAILTKRDTATPEFRPDLAGDYVIKLIINGESSKYSSEVKVTVAVKEVK